MANRVYDPESQEKEGHGTPTGEHDKVPLSPDEQASLDQMEAGLQRGDTAQDPEAKAKRSRQIYHGLNAGLAAGEHGLYGKRAEAPSYLARKELKRAEEEGFDFNKLTDKGWYKNELPKAALKRGTEGARKGFYHFFVKKHFRKLLVTLAFLLVPAVALVIIFFLAPFKHDHFETILRSANFARFQLLVRQQFSRVIFEASILNQRSVGTYQNSPLVRQLRLVIGGTDYQLGQLGESGRLKLEFKPNSSPIQQVLPLKESLQAVIVDGERYDIDEFSQRVYGANYADLPLDQKWAVGGQFIETIGPEKIGKMLRLESRTARWSPMTRVYQRTGTFLVRVLHGGRDYSGLTQEEARAKNAQDTANRVMAPSSSRIKSGIPDINEGAEETRQARIEGGAPGEVRGRIASRARLARGASDAVFLLTSYCISRELIKIFTPEYQAQKEAQAVRAGAFDMTATDQDKDGAIVSGQARYAINQKWDAQGDIPDASESVVYKNLTGQPLPDNPPPQQVPWLNPLLALGEWYPAYQQYNDFVAPFLIEGGIIPGILAKFGISIGGKEFNDGICTAMLNEYVQYGIAGGELVIAIASLGTVKGTTAAIKAGLSLVFHFAVGLSLDKLLSLLIEWTIEEFAGLYFSGLAQGADRVGETYVAQNSIAQINNRAVTYGRPLDLAETNDAQAEATLVMKEEFNKGSPARRYIALDNPFSLASLSLAKLPASPAGLAASVQTTFEFMGSMLTYPFRLLGSLGSMLSPHQPAYAAGIASTTSTYGVEQWGWSLAEQRRVLSDPNFSLQNLIPKVEPRMEELNERYAKCYDTTTYRLQIEKPTSGCAKDDLAHDDALYWRYYNALMFAASRTSGPL